MKVLETAGRRKAVVAREHTLSSVGCLPLVQSPAVRLVAPQSAVSHPSPGWPWGREISQARRNCGPPEQREFLHAWVTQVRGGFGNGQANFRVNPTAGSGRARWTNTVKLACRGLRRR